MPDVVFATSSDTRSVGDVSTTLEYHRLSRIFLDWHQLSETIMFTDNKVIMTKIGTLQFGQLCSL